MELVFYKHQPTISIIMVIVISITDIYPLLCSSIKYQVSSLALTVVSCGYPFISVTDFIRTDGV